MCSHILFASWIVNVESIVSPQGWVLQRAFDSLVPWVDLSLDVYPTLVTGVHINYKEETLI